MHPDTERYLSELRRRLTRERVQFRLVAGWSNGRSGWLLSLLSGSYAARIGARLRSLHDWPQPGRPA